MMFIGIATLLLCSFSGYVFEEEFCLDRKGKTVLHGERYFPMGSDPCTQCTCSNGKSEMCISVFCSPPENCRQYHTLNDKCCEFVCLDANYPHMPTGGNGTIGSNDADSLNATNLGLRLVASAFTSFLILALLLFMIHRLRQRRLLLVIRRLNGRLDTQGPNGGQQYSVDDETSVGYFVGRDHLDFGNYDEPPPPYSFWKPPNTYIPTGEAPPPYESVEQLPNGAQPESDGNANRGRKEVQCQSEPLVTQTANYELQNQLSAIATSSESHSHSSTQPTSGEGARVILSDEMCLAENVTVLHVRGPVGLCEDDIVNGNVFTNRVDPPVGYKRGDRRRTRSNADDRCHSYNEVLEEWRQRSRDAMAPVPLHHQRYSVQPIGRGSTCLTDPTVWSGEASESSSSSSPSSDQQTGSLSSSDSSSGDGLHARSLTFSKPVVVPVIDGSPRKASYGNGATKSKGKSSSLDRTFQNIKKLSLGQRKKSRGKLDSPTPDKFNAQKQKVSGCDESTAGSSSNLDGASQQTRKAIIRPSNLNITSASPPSSLSDNSSSGGMHPRSTSDSSDTGGPLPPTIVAIRCSSSARVNHLNSRFSDSLLLDNSDRPQMADVSFCSNELRRSASICSETGERRTRLGSIGASLANENREKKDAVIRTLDDSPRRNNINDNQFSFMKEDTCC